MAADFTRLSSELASCEDAGADLLHMDIMDGHFVPNISFGPRFVKQAGSVSTLPMEVHLMIAKPLDFLQAFIRAGASWITVHAETQNWVEALKAAKKAGLKAGVALKPKTPVSRIQGILPEVDLVLVMSVEPGFSGQKFMGSSLDKISQLHALKQEKGFDYIIGVDGGINQETGRECVAAGAGLLAVGSAFFKARDKKAFVQALKTSAGV